MPRFASRDGASKPFTWTTVFYLLLVLIAPLALFGTTAQAQEDSVENYGTVVGIDLGTTYSYVTSSRIVANEAMG
jgi:heat shock protein 5